MRPDLVLDDDDKRKRFRKLFLPTSDYESQQPSSAAGGNDCEKMAKPEMAPLLDVENIAQDESFVDPKIGEVSQPRTQPGKINYILTGEQHFSSFDNIYKVHFT